MTAHARDVEMSFVSFGAMPVEEALPDLRLSAPPGDALTAVFFTVPEGPEKQRTFIFVLNDAMKAQLLKSLSGGVEVAKGLPADLQALMNGSG